jgi:hypothetical protein
MPPLARRRNIGKKEKASGKTGALSGISATTPVAARTRMPDPGPLCGPTGNVPVLPETVCGKTGEVIPLRQPWQTPRKTFRSWPETSWPGPQTLAARPKPFAARPAPFAGRPEAGGEARRGDWSSHPRTAPFVLSGSADPQPARPRPTSRCAFPGQKTLRPKTTNHTDNKRIAQADHPRFPGPARAGPARFSAV